MCGNLVMQEVGLPGDHCVLLEICEENTEVLAGC